MCWVEAAWGICVLPLNLIDTLDNRWKALACLLEHMVDTLVGLESLCNLLNTVVSQMFGLVLPQEIPLLSLCVSRATLEPVNLLREPVRESDGAPRQLSKHRHELQVSLISLVTFTVQMCWHQKDPSTGEGHSAWEQEGHLFRQQYC